jgi:hypothetical protein
LDPKTLHAVLLPEVDDRNFAEEKTHHSTYPLQFKDPFIFRYGEYWHMVVIGFDRIERTYHFMSSDGEVWEKVGNMPILENTGWHNYFTRPACVVPMTVGFLLVYEGSNLNWWDPTYDIATGLAYSPDLLQFIDLTPKDPLLTSTTPSKYITWRYSHWIPRGNQMFVYFEAARPNNTNEIRLAKFNLDNMY